MATQPDVHDFPDVYQLEVTDEVLGGLGGTDNEPLHQLASRDLWLRREILALQLSNWTSAPLDLAPGWADDVTLEDACALVVSGAHVSFACGTKIDTGTGLFAGPLIVVTQDGGATWTTRSPDTSIPNGRLSGIAAHGTTVVACGTGDVGKWQVQRSTDYGDTWTLEASSTGDAANDIALAPSGIWAIAQENGLISAIPAVGELPNDIYPGEPLDLRAWNAITFDNSRFVAVGAGRIAWFTEAHISVAPEEGIACYVLPSGNTLDGIAYGNGTWLATGSLTAYAYHSTDLVTWTETFVGHGLASPIYVPQMDAFVCINTTDAHQLAILTRGGGETTFAKRAVPTLDWSGVGAPPPNLRALTRNPRTSAFVAVGNTVTMRSLQLGAV